MKDRIILELESSTEHFQFNTSMIEEIESSREEIFNLEESISTIERLTPDCDKIDYSIAISTATIAGLIDIFLVGEPKNSKLQDGVDDWVGDRVKDFSKLCGWDSSKNDSLSSAKRHLEDKFKIPYDQRGAGDAGDSISGLTPRNHHFKSMSHNPSMLGLFFSIVDQFTNQSHFISGGQLVSLQHASDTFVLSGSTIISKIYCGIINWFGHIISDVSGSSSSKGRGMGIPSPLWTWTNDIVAIKSKLNIPVTQFDKDFNQLALDLFNDGYDLRFQATQAIPVVLNELLVRFLYSLRRSVKYYQINRHEQTNYDELWSYVEPFSNVSVKRMLTVSHGAFCLIDLGDSLYQSYDFFTNWFNPRQFFLRLNIVGIGRFTISLYGEVNRSVRVKQIGDAHNIKRKKTILNHYIQGLEELAYIYEDNDLKNMISDFENSTVYIEAFESSIKLTEKRNVPEHLIIRTKEEGDLYFNEPKDSEEKF